MITKINAARIGFFVTCVAMFAIVLLWINHPKIEAAARNAQTDLDKPNFSGIWQTNNEANFDIEAHPARPAQVTQPGYYPKYDFARVPAAPVLALGAAAGVPGSLGVVQGDGIIPYKQDAAAKKKENAEHWIDRDPELKCYLPGIPRAMYMPWIESGHTVTPSPVNPLGVKGVGEAGTIGCSPAVVNSVVDALSPLGVRHIDMPMTPEKIWKLLQGGKA